MEPTQNTEKVTNEEIPKDVTSSDEPISKPTALSPDTSVNADQETDSAITVQVEPTPQTEPIPHVESAPQVEPAPRVESASQVDSALQAETSTSGDVTEPKENSSHESVTAPPPEIHDEGTTVTKNVNPALEAEAQSLEKTAESNSKEGNSEDEGSVAGDANKTGTPGPKQKTPRSRASFDKPTNLPDKDASDLTDEQVSHLIRQSPAVRKQYQVYFTANGIVRPSHYHVLFARDASGDLCVEEKIIKSNVHRWEETLERYESKSAGPFRKTAARATPAKRTVNETDDAEAQTPSQKRARNRSAPSAPATGHSKSPDDSSLFVPPDSSTTATSSTPRTRSQKGTTGRNIVTFPNPQGKKQKDPQKDPQKETRKEQKGTGSLARNEHPENMDSEDDSALHPLFNNTLCHWTKNHQFGELSFLEDSDITDFTDWLSHEVDVLHKDLAKVTANGTPKHRELLIGVLISLYKLRLAVQTLGTHMRAEKERAQNIGQDMET